MRMKWAVLLLCCVPFVSGCNGCRNEWKHSMSENFGLKRTVTLYNGNGEKLKSWTTTSQLEYNGSTVWFIDDDEKVVSVSGTIIIEEE